MDQSKERSSILPYTLVLYLLKSELSGYPWLQLANLYISYFLVLCLFYKTDGMVKKQTKKKQKTDDTICK